MSTENVGIEYRPLRIGLCIRNGNMADLVAAAKLSSLLWGGVFNPIIPVGAANDLAETLVDRFQVDVLVPIVEGIPEIEVFMEKYKWARFPMMSHSGAILTSDGYNQGKQTVSVLDVSHLLRKLWNNEFKFAADGKSNCAYVSWKATDSAKNLFPLLFGCYPKANLSYPYEKNFKEALKAQVISLESGKVVPAVTATRITPIGLTEQDIKSFGGRFQGSGIYVGDPDDFEDLLTFWNIRATDSYITFLPKTDTQRFISYAKTFISRIKKTGDFGEPKAAVTVWFKKETDTDHVLIKELIKPLESADRIFLMNAMIPGWHGASLTASYNVLGEASCVANIGAKYGRETISIQLSDKPFPKRDERRYRDQFYVVSMRQIIGLDIPEHTTNLPRLPDLNEWYSREMVFDRYAIRVTKSYNGTSLGVITDISREAVEIGALGKFALIKKIFERAGITAEKSAPGLVAERLIALMGGVSGAARIFKITGVRKFIEETSPLQQLTKSEIESKIFDGGTFNNFATEFGLKGRSPMTTEDVFETMVEKNLIQAGVEVRCPKCSLKAWLTLRDVDEMYSCEYCQERSKFVEVVDPVTVKVGDEVKSIDGVRWFYRLSGLLGKSDKQQGAVPVVLTLQHLANRMHHTFGGESIRSTALNLDYEKGGKKQKGETDLVVFDMDHRMGKEDFEILIGECKTGQSISRAQVDRLVDVKRLLEKSGVKCHLIFIKTKGTFSAAEIGHFKRLVKEGIKPLLFTSIELERWWDEYKTFKASRTDFKLPVEHPFTFSELAENAVYVYQLQ